MRLLVAIPGVLLILIILWDAFETIILPRRVMRRIRLTTFFYRLTWSPFTFLANKIDSLKRREKYLGLFGPLSLLFLLGMWVTGIIVGYAMVQWAIHSTLNLPDNMVDFGIYLYLSGVTFFTVGYGDVAPVSAVGRAIEVIEAANGFALLAIVIGYLPVL